MAVQIRYDFSPPPDVIQLSILVGFLCATAYFILAGLLNLYRGRYVVGSFDEVLGILTTTAVVGLTGSLILFSLPPGNFPRTTIAVGAGIALLAMLGVRFAWRGSRRRKALSRKGTKTLIYGAGDAGSQIVNLMLSDSDSDFQPVGFLDDDPKKQHLRRSGIRVLGTLSDLENIVASHGIETLLIAIARVPAERLLALDRRCAFLRVKVRIIPTASEIAGGAVRLGDISDVTEEDVMGRRPIHTNEDQIASFVRQKRVLITGAGGSIGSELARQVSRYGPAELHILDRDESALHAVQLSIDGTGTLASENLVLADIRDADNIMSVFTARRPNVVFHAAALKHLPMLERFPEEAFKTNVLGTLNVLKAAEATGVEALVNISTDIAADPTSVLGWSKLIAERLTAQAPSGKTGTFVSVRFGNVLGSRGSVLDTFRYQIATGGPVTVTSDEVTRYFMTISEAVHLVLQASVLGRRGETLVLDMGEPVRIFDIAKYMIERSGRKVDICITGLRAGEKVHEVLIADAENPVQHSHPLIFHVQVPPLALDVPLRLRPRDANREALQELAKTVPHLPS